MQVSRYPFKQRGDVPTPVTTATTVSSNQSKKKPKNTSVPCPYHPEFSITNMCTAMGCVEALCAECIGIHTSDHELQRTTSKIDTIFNKQQECLSILKD